MPWVKRRLRGTVVLARTDASGNLASGPDGRVDVVYKAEPGAKLYRAAAANLETAPELEREPPLPDAAIIADPGKKGQRSAPAVASADSVVVYTDGACTGHPGPMGIGVVVLSAGQRQELSEYLGVGTNNIAELTAIERGLEVVEGLGQGAVERPVLVHSDSAYALGLLGKGWKAKANVELVERLRRLARRFPRVAWIKVAGHAGIPENERCDELARAAVVRRR
jgi:ribonuclease HI